MMKTSARFFKTETDSSVHSSKQNSGKNSFFASGNKTNEKFFGPSTLQPKLEIGQQDDPYEREADRVADQVMRMPDTAIQTFDNEEEELQMKREPAVQMACEDCGEKEVRMKSLVQQKADTGNTQTVPPEIASDIRSKNGSGRPLPEQTQQEMSSKIGADFSSVRVHRDNTAIQLNRDLGAKAFTAGNNIFFNQGQYRPDSGEGKRLLAHELAHIIQQSESGQMMVQRSVDPAVCKVLEFEQEHGTWATIREYNALSGTIPGRGLEVLRSTGAPFDLNWALDVSYVSGMTGGTCSDIVGTVFGRPGVVMCGGTGYISGGMSYYFARLIGAAVEGYEHGVGVGWNYLTRATLDEANVNGAEVGMLVGASGARSHATPFRAFVHTSVLDECGLLNQSPVKD